jgi:hypothetical protein
MSLTKEGRVRIVSEVRSPRNRFGLLLYRHRRVEPFLLAGGFEGENRGDTELKDKVFRKYRYFLLVRPGRRDRAGSTGVIVRRASVGYWWRRLITRRP